MKCKAEVHYRDLKHPCTRHSLTPLWGLPPRLRLLASWHVLPLYASVQKLGQSRAWVHVLVTYLQESPLAVLELTAWGNASCACLEVPVRWGQGQGWKLPLAQFT